MTVPENDDASSGGHWEGADDVLELPLILSRQQVLQLAELAERQGMTSAQFLRRCITNICSLTGNS